MRAPFISFILVAGLAAATAQAETVTIGPAPVGSTASASFAQFNGPGALTGVTVGATSTLASTIQIESLESASSLFSAGIGSTITVTAPGNATLVQTNNTITQLASLAAYDGTTDYAGASGRTFHLTDTETATTTLTAGQGAIPLAPFVGTGSVPLGVATAGGASITAPLNTSLKLASTAGTSISVGYTGGGGPNTPGTGGSAGSGTGAIDNLPIYLPFGARTTATQTRTLGQATTGAKRAVTFTGFDPSLGTLVGVELNLGGTARTMLDITGTLPSDPYNVNQIASLSLLDTTGANALTADGGISTSGLGTDSNSESFPILPETTIDATNLADFISSGALTLFVDSTGLLSATLPDTADLESRGTADATVTVAYVYVPITTPEPAGMAVGALGLLALAATRRPA